MRTRTRPPSPSDAPAGYKITWGLDFSTADATWRSAIERLKKRRTTKMRWEWLMVGDHLYWTVDSSAGSSKDNNRFYDFERSFLTALQQEGAPVTSTTIFAPYRLGADRVDGGSSFSMPRALTAAQVAADGVLA